MDDDLRAIQQTLDAVKLKVDDICEILTGNGDSDKGLVVRFALVERQNRRFDRLLWLVGSAAVTLGLGGIAAAIAL